MEWPAGTTTCADLEDDFPVGVDDHRLDLARGIVTYHDPRLGAEASIQFVDDPSCTAGSAAWRFMIGPLLDADRLWREAALCEPYAKLVLADPAPVNRDTVVFQLPGAERLCR